MKITDKWVPRDHDREQSNKKQAVTPYGHLAGDITGARAFQSGASEPLRTISLEGQVQGMWKRFLEIDPGLKWEEIPENLLEGVKTLGELCMKLNKTQPTKFPDRLYAAKELASTSTQISKMPQLMFDFWENTELRHAIINSEGKFSWDMDPKTIPIIGKQRWRALALSPQPVPAPVTTFKPTAQNCQQTISTDLDLTKLDAEIKELRRLAVSVITDVASSEREIEARGRALAPFVRLHVLLQCAGGHGTMTGTDGSTIKVPGGNAVCTESLAKVESILKVAKEKMLHQPIDVTGARTPWRQRELPARR